MSDYYYSFVGRSRHAELIEQARQDGLAKALPHRPGPWTRIRARFTGRSGSPVTAARAEGATPAGAAQRG